jgi:hypothetical protein
MPAVMRPPTPSKTTMSTNEASQLDVICGPPYLRTDNYAQFL